MRSHGTGPKSSSGTSSSMRGARTCPRAEVDPVRHQVRALAREHGVRDRRKQPLTPPPEPIQLTLGV